MVKKSKLTIYVQDETDFSHNGLGILHPKSCKVERNLLEYTNTMNLVYPIDDTNKWLLLLENRVIKWKQQYYRIYNINKSVEKKEVTAYAKHIFFDLQKNFIFDVNVVNKDGALALTQLLGGTQYSHRFTGHSNIGNKNNLRMVRKNVVDALIGDGNSFINRWGGELDFDGFNFYFNHKIGADNGYKIKYGKNLQGLTLDTNMLSVVTRIVPIGFDAIMLDEKYVDSAYIDNYAMPIIKEYKYENVKWSGSPNYEENDNDDSVVFDNLADAQAELRRRATLEFTENEVDLPTVTCTVDFLELSKTEEYAEFTHLETVNLGDTVTIYHKPFNVYMKARCIAYTFDVLKDAYESITLGSYVKNYFTESNNVNGQIEDLLDTNLSDKINSVLQVAKDEASKLITSAMGGYVYKTNDALYIMDNEDPKLAKRVWCWNINGLGYSSTGINGEYGLAILMNGSIVADFITVGNLNGNLITANTIKIESLELETQQKITNATDEKQVTALIKAGLDGFESSLSETFVTHEQSREDITTAKSETLNDAKEFVTTKLQSYDTSESVDSKISQSKSAIEFGISTKYETKENVETKVTEAIDGVTVGAINRVFGTSEQKSFTFTGGSNEVFIAYDICEDISDKEVIVSFDYTFIGDVIVGSELKFQSQYLSKSNQVTYAPKHIFYTSDSVKTVNLNDTVKFSVVWNGVKQDCKFRFVANGLTGTFTVNHVQIKVGNKLTEWSVAPEDVEENIETAKSDAISIANNSLNTTIANYYTKEQTDSQIQVAKDAINLGVSQTYETKEDVINKINGVTESVSNLTQRMTSAESKITDTEITNTVKKNFYTKEETEDAITTKGYATSTELQQTATDFTYKFSRSGGYNVVRNGNAKNGQAYWHTYHLPEASWGIRNDEWTGYEPAIQIHAQNNTTVTNAIYQIVEGLIDGEIYTFSALVAGHRGTNRLVVTNSEGNAEIGWSDEAVDCYGGANINGWKRISGTFVARGNRCELRLYHYNGWGNSLGWFKQIQISRGSVPLPYSPHPSEVYDGIITMDKDGFDVATSYGAHTQFHSGGMSSYNNSNQRTLGIENGGISFHAWNNNALSAYITQSSLWGGSQSANGLAISTTANGTYLALGTSSLSDVNTTLNIDQALTISASDGFQPRGINFWKDVHAHGYGIRQLSHLHLAGSGAIQFDYLNNSPSTIYEAVDNGHSLYVMGGYQMHLGVMEGSGSPHAVIWMRGKTDTHSYTHWDFHNYTMYNMRTASTYVNTLTKTLAEAHGVTSNVDGVRYLYRDIELIDGKAVRNLPNGYKGCNYDIVSIVCKGKGQAWIESEEDNRFEINGDCKFVNVEIIIYPGDDVMMLSTVNTTEAPPLELPKEVTSEIAPPLTNESYNSCDFRNQYMCSKYSVNQKNV